MIKELKKKLGLRGGAKGLGIIHQEKSAIGHNTVLSI